MTPRILDGSCASFRNRIRGPGPSSAFIADFSFSALRRIIDLIDPDGRTSSTILPRVHFVYISFGIPVDTGVRRLHNNLIYGFMENLAVSAIEMSSDSYIYFVHTNSHDIEKAYVQKREPRFIPPPCLS